MGTKEHGHDRSVGRCPGTEHFPLESHSAMRARWGNLGAVLLRAPPVPVFPRPRWPGHHHVAWPDVWKSVGFALLSKIEKIIVSSWGSRWIFFRPLMGRYPEECRSRSGDAAPFEFLIRVELACVSTTKGGQAFAFAQATAQGQSERRRARYGNSVRGKRQASREVSAGTSNGIGRAVQVIFFIFVFCYFGMARDE